jgi:signal peptidase I
MQKAFLRQTYLNARAFVLLVILFVFFRTAVADWSPVPSGSMEPTLMPGSAAGAASCCE